MSDTGWEPTSNESSHLFHPSDTVGGAKALGDKREAVGQRGSVSTHTRRPETDFWCLLQLLSTFFKDRLSH